MLDKIRQSSKPLAALLVLAAVLFFGVQAGRAAAPPAPQPQPHMESALDHLRKAKADLEAADPDKGGHRAQALRLVSDAMIQVEKGIRFDNKH